jgi:spermidine synthase
VVLRPGPGRKGAARLAALAACALLVATPGLLAGIPGTGGWRVLFEADSVYHHIVVAEDGEARYLRFDRAVQSGMLLSDPFESPFLYAAYAHLGLIFAPRPKRVLVIGLGGGSIPKRFWRDYPETTVEVAELDPMVVDVATRFFDVREHPRLRLVSQDGRLFLRRTAAKFDLIILDAYFAESIPFHLTTKEFYTLVRSRLAPGGAVVSNLLGALTGPRSSLFRAMYKSHAAVFPGLYPFPVAYLPDQDVYMIRNIMLVATADGRLTRAEIRTKARQAAAGRVTFPQFATYAADYYGEAIRLDDVPVLTDDYAPVDAMLPLYHWTPRRP